MNAIPQKSLSKSSVKPLASKTSLKSDAGSVVSVENETSLEVHHGLDTLA